MTHHKKAAKLIRDLVGQLELLAAKAQVQVDDDPETGSGTEILEERVDAIEEAICDLLNAVENLELID